MHETTDPSSLVYYAHKFVREHDGVVSYQTVCPRLWWVQLHGFSEPIVTVRIRESRDEDPPSDYFGWIDSDDPGEFTFVMPCEGMLEMCFPYGSKAESDRGRGRKVNLIVEEIVA